MPCVIPPFWGQPYGLFTSEEWRALGQGAQGGAAMTRLQTLYLRRLHGLSEAQAHALAVLIWGVSQ